MGPGGGGVGGKSILLPYPTPHMNEVELLLNHEY